MKNLLIYLPYTWPTISTRVFKSFLDLTSFDAQKQLIDNYDIKTSIFISNTFPLDRSRNEAVDLAVSSKYSADYIFFADGDNIWPSNTLQTLLNSVSDEFPVVSGLYFRKSPPYVAVPGHYSTWEKHELKRKTIEEMGFVDQAGNQCLYYKPVQDFDTVQPIDVAGMGCVLVRTDVFQKIDLPYFGYFNSYSLGGDFAITHSSEEMLFYCKLRKAGIKTLLVPTVRCGHEVLKVVGCPEEP